MSKVQVEKYTNPDVSALIGTLFDKSSGAEFTKSELERLVLDKVGVTVNEAILSDIFDECDADGSGRVSQEELVNYINGIKDSTSTNRMRYVLKESLLSEPFWPLLFFITGLLIELSLNVKTRNGNEYMGRFNLYGLSALCYTVGSFVFVAFVFVAIKKNLKLRERANEKVVLWAKTGFTQRKSRSVKDRLTCTLEKDVSRSTDSSTDDEEDVGITVLDLKIFLENSSIFLPTEMVRNVFKRIDKDNNGCLTFAEIRTYADAHERSARVTAFNFNLVVLRKCATSIDFWLNWGWVIGGFFFALAGYAPGAFSSNTIHHINGIGCALFLFCAVVQLRTVFKNFEDVLQYAQDLHVIFHSLVLSLMSKEKSKGSEEEGMANQNDDMGTKDAITLRNASSALFDVIDAGGSDGDGDGNLSFIELYDALIRAGFVVPLETLKSVFKQADKSGDGEIQIEEFIEYIASIKIEITGQERFWNVVKVMVKDISFWEVLSQINGGVGICVANYRASMSDVTKSYVTMVALISWVLPFIDNLYQLIIGHVHHFNAIQYSRSKFKKELLHEFSGSGDHCTVTIAQGRGK